MSDPYILISWLEKDYYSFNCNGLRSGFDYRRIEHPTTSGLIIIESIPTIDAQNLVEIRGTYLTTDHNRDTIVKVRRFVSDELDGLFNQLYVPSFSEKSTPHNHTKCSPEHRINHSKSNKDQRDKSKYQRNKSKHQRDKSEDQRNKSKDQRDKSKDQRDKSRCRSNRNTYEKIAYTLQILSEKSLNKDQLVEEFINDLSTYLIYTEFLQDPEVMSTALLPFVSINHSSAPNLISNQELLDPHLYHGKLRKPNYLRQLDYTIKCCLRYKLYPTMYDGWLTTVSEFFDKWKHIFRDNNSLSRTDRQLIKDRCRALVNIKTTHRGRFSNNVDKIGTTPNNLNNYKGSCYREDEERRPIYLTTQITNSANFEQLKHRIEQLEASNFDLCHQINHLHHQLDRIKTPAQQSPMRRN